jgi:hypothetical protein
MSCTAHDAVEVVLDASIAHGTAERHKVERPEARAGCEAHTMIDECYRGDTTTASREPTEARAAGVRDH